LRSQWATKALKAGKHVLLDLPASSSAQEYATLIKEAHLSGKYLQDCTIFIHLTRVQDFIKIVTNDRYFGDIKQINVFFSIKEGDGPLLESDTWSTYEDGKMGSIAGLAWYSIYLGILVLARAGLGTVVCAQAVSVGYDDKLRPKDTELVVGFSKVRFTLQSCDFERGDLKTDLLMGLVFLKPFNLSTTGS